MDVIKYSELINQMNLTKGYGTNKNWIGYFERTTKFSGTVLREGISFFLNYFPNELHEFVIASSLYFHNSIMNSESPFRILKIVTQAEQNLLKRKQINVIKFCEDDDYNQKGINSPRIDLDNKFQFFNADKESLEWFSIISMSDSHLQEQDGHCFFISFSLNVIIYPHGDLTGYGCFVIDRNRDSVATKFLRQADTMNSFRAIFSAN